MLGHALNKILKTPLQIRLKQSRPTSDMVGNICKISGKISGKISSKVSANVPPKIAQFPLILLSAIGGFLVTTIPSHAVNTLPNNRLEAFTLDVTKNRIDFATLKDLEPRGKVILNPARIVIDLPGATYRGATVRRAIGRAVKEVRVGQVEADTTRLVVEFSPDMAVDMQNLKMQATSARSWSIQLPENVATSTLSSAMFNWPLIGTLTAGFGWRVHPISGTRKMHKGIDIAAPIGAPILASADGVVADADFDSDYGNFVELSHSDGSKTMYGHANRLLVAKGMMVRKGQAIAEVGTTGRSTGPHLHFEFMADGKQASDPMAILPQRFVLFDVAAR
jgi:murein DD-endopeptidase MepM/ murein hydrolase activator NlpD